MVYLLSDMTNIDVTSVAWWVTNLGPSGVICFMIWRVLLFLKPIILEHIPLFKEFIIRHFNLMTVAEEQLKNGNVKLVNLENKQDAQGILIQEIHDKVHSDK
jgi:hypothetical protein